MNWKNNEQQEGISVEYNYPLADRCMGYKVNKFEQVGGVGAKVNKFTRFGGGSYVDCE